MNPEPLGKMDAYWRAANYLSVGQICFYDNPLLKEPLKLSHMKPLVVGYWGTTPGQNFITAWQSNKLLDPITEGAVLPILHRNGYKISNPTVLARSEPEELDQFLRGRGWTPHFVEGDELEKMHQLMAGTVETAIEDTLRIQGNARNDNDTTRPRWPMIVLRSPKGWTGPKVVDGCRQHGPAVAKGLMTYRERS